MPEVRIPVCLCSSGFRPRETNFSDKEKDEASPPACCRRNSSSAFIPRFAGAWRHFAFGSRWSLTKTVPPSRGI
jgi:hypothetical protein